MNKIVSMAAVSSTLVCCLLAGARPGNAADKTEVFASGLEFPSKLISLGGGNLLVTEAGQMANSGRISLVDAGGLRRTILDGLPSGLAAPDFMPDGPNGVAVAGHTMYITNAEGDTHINGPKPGTLLSNPAGPSSPLFSTLLRVTFNENIEALATAFSLQLHHHFTLADGKAVLLKNDAGQRARVELVTAFRADRPDPFTILRNTHLYGVTSLGTEPFSFYVADAGNNAIWRVNLLQETPRLVTRFPNTPNPIFPKGPPTSEAVPTSIHPLGPYLLVSLLGGAPFVPGISRVMLVDPKTGDATQLLGGLSSTIDVLPRGRRASVADGLFVLEYSTNLTAGAPGRLLGFSPNGTKVLASNLTTPSSMALDEDSRSLFVTNRSEGKIVRVPSR